jgi:hypothetical protein
VIPLLDCDRSEIAAILEYSFCPSLKKREPTDKKSFCKVKKSVAFSDQPYIIIGIEAICMVQTASKTERK